MKSKVFALSISIIVVTLTSCSKENPGQELDALQQIGIPGQWKLEIRLVNGITNLAVKCCDYIDLKTNDQPNDLKGNFTSTGSGYETNGTFELDTIENTILFEFKNKQLLYSYQLDGNVLTFEYSENGQAVIEDWWRIEE